MLPEVHKLLCLYLTMPVRMSTSERSFLLKHLYYVRAMMTDRRLNNCMLVHAEHQEITDNLYLCSTSTKFCWFHWQTQKLLHKLCPLVYASIGYILKRYNNCKPQECKLQGECSNKTIDYMNVGCSLLRAYSRKNIISKKIIHYRPTQLFQYKTTRNKKFFGSGLIKLGKEAFISTLCLLYIHHCDSNINICWLNAYCTLWLFAIFLLLHTIYCRCGIFHGSYNWTY